MYEKHKDDMCRMETQMREQIDEAKKIKEYLRQLMKDAKEDTRGSEKVQSRTVEHIRVGMAQQLPFNEKRSPTKRWTDSQAIIDRVKQLDEKDEKIAGPSQRKTEREEEKNPSKKQEKAPVQMAGVSSRNPMPDGGSEGSSSSSSKKLWSSRRDESLPRRERRVPKRESELPQKSILSRTPGRGSSVLEGCSLHSPTDPYGVRGVLPRSVDSFPTPSPLHETP